MFYNAYVILQLKVTRDKRKYYSEHSIKTEKLGNIKNSMEIKNNASYDESHI